jgi:hypothetical protein
VKPKLMLLLVNLALLAAFLGKHGVEPTSWPDGH